MEIDSSELAGLAEVVVFVSLGLTVHLAEMGVSAILQALRHAEHRRATRLIDLRPRRRISRAVAPPIGRTIAVRLEAGRPPSAAL